MRTDTKNSRPLSVKFALVSAAVGAGFAAPAHAGFISTAPAGFVPLTFDRTQTSSYALDLDRNGTTDFTITSGSNWVLIKGATSAAQVDSFAGSANGYANTSAFLSASSIKGAQSASFVSSSGGHGLAGGPYSELVFAGAHGLPTRGYVKGSVDAATQSTYTLSDFGVEGTPSKVPEPGTLALLAAGAAGIGALRRRRSARAL
jgi:hypothetical protein